MTSPSYHDHSKERFKQVSICTYLPIIHGLADVIFCYFAPSEDYQRNDDEDNRSEHTSNSGIDLQPKPASCIIIYCPSLPSTVTILCLMNVMKICSQTHPRSREKGVLNSQIIHTFALHFNKLINFTFLLAQNTPWKLNFYIIT